MAKLVKSNIRIARETEEHARDIAGTDSDGSKTLRAATLIGLQLLASIDSDDMRGALTVELDRRLREDLHLNDIAGLALSKAVRVTAADKAKFSRQLIREENPAPISLIDFLCD